MAEFSHLSVLISIILGLGVAHLLANVHRLIQARAHVRLYWLPLVWTVLIFVTQVEWWWASFTLREHLAGNFFYFLFVLLSPVALYLAAAFVLPQIEPDRTYDLRDYYYTTRGWFFGIVAMGPALDALRRMLDSNSYTDFGGVSNAVSALLVATLAVSGRPWYHTLVTLVVSALFMAFIVSSALQLR